jgi:predicted metal-dependent hydrolase
METNELIVGKIKVEVIRKDIKNLHLSVHPPNGWVRVASPISINDDSVRLYVISKMNWIRKQQREFDKQERQIIRQYISRESHYLGGERYLLRVNYHDAPAKVVLQNKGYIDLYIRENSTLEQRRKVMQEWYRERLKLEIAPMIEKWQKKIGVEINEWGIKQMKTKWGTCNIESKRIWINLELAKKPIRCLEYIIVHELIHLLERNHNQKFINYLDQFFPNWRIVKTELNTIILGYVEWDD